MWLTAIGMCVLLSGCSAVDNVSNSVSQLFAVSEEETFAQERQFLADYEAHKAEFAEDLIVSWVQPVNKKEKCQIQVNVPAKEWEKMPERDYYWDGACKDGYAYGLGRQFNRSEETYRDTLSEYKKPGQAPTSYYLSDKLRGVVISGVENSESTIGQGFMFQDNSNGFDFLNVATIRDVTSLVTYERYYNPITQFERVMKRYPNFAYVFELNHTDNTGWVYLSDSNNVASRYAFMFNAQGEHQGAEKTSPSAQAEPVTLPESYWERLMTVKREIDAQFNQAMFLQRNNRAKLAKQEYTSQKCSAKVPAPFSSWPDYLDICKEDEFIEGLLAKVSEKAEAYQAQLAAQAQQRQQAAIAQAQIQTLNAQRHAAYAQSEAASAQRDAANAQRNAANTWQNSILMPKMTRCSMVDGWVTCYQQ